MCIVNVIYFYINRLFSLHTTKIVVSDRAGSNYVIVIDYSKML